MCVAITVAFARAAAGEVLGVRKATDVVADARAGLVARRSDGRAPRIDTDRNVKSLRELGDHRHHTIELFFFTDLVTGSRFDAADV